MPEVKSVVIPSEIGVVPTHCPNCKSELITRDGNHLYCTGNTCKTNTKN